MNALLRILLGSLLLTTVVGCGTSTPKVSAHSKPEAKDLELRDAWILYEAGKYDAAEQKLEGLLRKDPQDPMAQYLLLQINQGRQHRETGQEKPWGYIQTYPPQPLYR